MVVSRTQSKSLYFNSQHDNVHMMNTSDKNKRSDRPSTHLPRVWLCDTIGKSGDQPSIALGVGLRTNNWHGCLKVKLEYIFQHYYNF